MDFLLRALLRAIFNFLNVMTPFNLVQFLKFGTSEIGQICGNQQTWPLHDIQCNQKGQVYEFVQVSKHMDLFDHTKFVTVQIFANIPNGMKMQIT